MLSRQVHEVLVQSLDYTEQLERITVEAQEGLAMPPELNNGLCKQRIQLDELVKSFDLELGECSDPKVIDAWLFRRVCDTWSLHTRNAAFQALVIHLFELLSDQSAVQLFNDLNKQICILHVSCRDRIALAQKSIASFQVAEGELSHVIVIGNADASEGGFCFSYDGTLLTLSCGDDYESLCKKTLLCFTVMHHVARPKLLYKVDDDVLLESIGLFQGHLDDLAGRNAMYAGTPTKGSPNHRNLWHGWHLGKCRRQDLERIGYQTPVGSHYADGGYGYVLGGAALDELSYAFLTHQAFLNVSSILYEDATVGLFLQLAGVELIPVDSSATGLSSGRRRVEMQLKSNWQVFSAKVQEHAKKLETHQIFSSKNPTSSNLSVVARLSDSSPSTVIPRFNKYVKSDLSAAIKNWLRKLWARGG